MDLLNNINKLKKSAPKIYDILEFYYPFLLFKKEQTEYWNYHGIKSMITMINTNIVNEINFDKNWTVGICKELESLLNRKITGATFGLTPDYGGIIELENNIDSQMMVELHFYISFLKNVYSIQIVYLNKNMKIRRNMKYVKDFYGKGIETLVVSPIKGYYDNEFNIIESFIDNKFKKAIFLPYSIDILKLKGLEVTYTDKEVCTVGDAFFNKGLPINYYYESIPYIIGDKNYKIEKLK